MQAASGVPSRNVEQFANPFSQVLSDIGLSTYELARLIQESGATLDGCSRDSLDSYRRGERPPRPQVWKVIRAILVQQAEGDQAAKVEELNGLHKQTWNEWVENKKQPKGDQPSEPAYREVKLSGAAFIGYILAAIFLTAFLWSLWDRAALESAKVGGPTASALTPSQAAGQTEWTTSAPTSKLPMGEIPLWGTIDKADADEQWETYEYVAEVPKEFAGNPLTIGIAGADDAVELLLYKDGVFQESRDGKDIHIDFTDGPGARWWVRVRNRNRRDVRYLLYFMRRPR